MNTRPLDEPAPDYPKPYPTSSSVGHDDSQKGVGNLKLNIDLGKSVNVIGLCATLCGISLAINAVLYQKLVQRESEIHAMQRTDYNAVLTRVQLLDNHVTKLQTEHDAEKLHERR